MTVSKPETDGKAPETAIATSQEDILKILMENVLSKEEKEQINNGANCDISMSIKDVNEAVPAVVKEKVANKASGYTVGSYLDISLMMKFTKNGMPVPNSGKVLDDLGAAELEIVITVPARLINHDGAVDREYVIVREHRGVYELLPAVFDKAAGTLKFKSGKYSTYAIAYRDIPTTVGESDDDSDDHSGKTQNVNKASSPKTGDYMGNAAMGWFLVLMAAGIGTVVTVKRRKESK